MVRPGRRSARELGLGRKLMEWILENRDDLKGANFRFRTLARKWGKLSDKPLKSLVVSLIKHGGAEIDDIRLKLMKLDSEVFIHINPTGSDVEGYWPWLSDWVWALDATVSNVTGLPRLWPMLPGMPFDGRLPLPNMLYEGSK